MKGNVLCRRIFSSILRRILTKRLLVRRCADAWDKMEAVTATPDYQSNTKKPLKETIILAVAFLCVFAPFQAIQNLQSSLNQMHGLGVTSLACLYGSMFAVSFITPAIVYNVGVKATIMTAWTGHILYLICNFYPTWITLIPGSIMLGLISCPLWTSTETYLSTMARAAAELELGEKSKKPASLHAHFSRLNGVFSSIFNASQFIGNLVSSAILFRSSYDDPYMTSPSTDVTYAPGYCGAAYCPREGEGKHIPLPQEYIVYILLAVFLVLDLVGLSLTAKFVTNLTQPQYTGREIGRKLKSYLTAFRQPKLWLLVPLVTARGMIFTIHIGLFSEAYVSCSLGIRMVGYAMAVWGLTTMMSSALLGYAARFTGRQFLCGVAFLVDGVILLVLLLWRPHSSHLAAFLSLAMLMGLVDGIWGVQVNAFIAVMFPSIVDSAFAAAGTWRSLAVASSWLMATFLCPVTRIYTAMGLLGAGLLGYVAAEVLHRRSLRLFERDEHEYVLLSSSQQQGELEDDDLRELDAAEETVFDASTDRASRRGRAGNALSNSHQRALQRGVIMEEDEELENLLEERLGGKLVLEGVGAQEKDTSVERFPRDKVPDVVLRETDDSEDTFFDAEAVARLNPVTVPGPTLSSGGL